MVIAAIITGLATAFFVSLVIGIVYVRNNPNVVSELTQLATRLDRAEQAIWDSHGGEPCPAEDSCPPCREKREEYARLRTQYRKMMLRLVPLLPAGAVLYWGPQWGRWLLHGSEAADPSGRSEPASPGALAGLIPFRRRHRRWMSSAAELGTVTLACHRDAWRFLADWTAARHDSTAAHWWWRDGQPPQIVEEPDGQTVTIRLPGTQVAEMLAAMHWTARRADRDTRTRAAQMYQELTGAIERAQPEDEPQTTVDTET